MNILEEIQEANTHLNRVKAAIQARITDLPDNPKIRRLAPRNCFVVRFSDLGNNWSPEFHDWQAQYRRIVAEIERRGFDGMAILFTEIVQRGWIRQSTEPHSKFTFAPEVRQFVSEITGIKTTTIRAAGATIEE